MSKRIVILLLVFTFLLTSCQGEFQLFKPTATPVPPTVTVTLTPTPTPTATPEPTPTPTTTPFSQINPFRLESGLDGLLTGDWFGMQLSDNALWLLSTGGAVKWNLADSSFTTIKYSLPVVGIDGAGVLWTQDKKLGNLNLWNGVSWSTTKTHEGWLAGTLLAQTPLDFAPFSAENGNIWFSPTWGAARFDGKAWSRYSFYTMGFKTPPAGTTRSLLFTESPDGTSWAASCLWHGNQPASEGGLSRFDGSNWSRVSLPENETCLTLLKTDENGQLWIGSTTSLIIYNPVDNSQQTIPFPVLIDNATISYVADLQFNPQGVPWVIFALCNPNGCGDLKVRYQWFEKMWSQVGEIGGFAMLPAVFDRNGNAWLVSDYTVQVINGAKHITVSELKAFGIAVDKLGRIFILAEHGTEPGLWILDSFTIP